jgi:hypothetical protein
MTSWVARYQTYATAERLELRRAVGRRLPAAVGPEDASCLAVVAPVGDVLLGEDVQAALRKAFAALGADFEAVRVVPASRGGDEPRLGWPRILAWEIELTDPDLTLALGDEAAAALERAGPGGAPPGRRVVAIPDPARALADPKGKRALWDALKSVAAALPQV